jgi:galactonate dehydratase
VTGTGSNDRISGFTLRNIRASAKTVWRHILLHTESGLTGTGEYTFDNRPPDLAAQMAARAESLVGGPARRSSLAAIRKASRGLSDYSMLSGLDQALADIEAQSKGVPIWKLIGADNAPATVPIYANINRRTEDRTPEGFAASARQALAAGARAIKIAPFDDLTPELCAADEGRVHLQAGLARIAAVSDATGKAVPIYVDCHWRLTPDAAHSCLQELARLGVVWFECPCPETVANIGELKRIRHAANDLGMRLAGLESEGGWEGFRPFVEAGAYDVIMPDIKHAGGYEDCLEISEKAGEHGVAVSLHNPSGPIAHCASVHMTAAIGPDELLETQFDETKLFDRITDPAPVKTGSECPASNRAGLGAKLLGRIETEEPAA